MKNRIVRVASVAILMLLFGIPISSSAKVSGETELKTGILAENGNQSRSPETEYTDGNKFLPTAIFSGEEIVYGWEDWSWDVDRFESYVSSQQWGGVYMRASDPAGLQPDDYSSLVVSVSMGQNRKLLVNLVSDVDQPVIEIQNGETVLELDQLLAEGTEVFYGIQIRSPESQDYTLHKVHLNGSEQLTSQIFLPVMVPNGKPEPYEEPEDDIYDLFATACGGIVQEAENGVLHGRMQKVQTDDGYAIAGKGTQHGELNTGDRVDYCFTVPQKGYYWIEADVHAPDSGRNSIFWTIDGKPNDGNIWHMEVTKGYSRQSVSAGGDPNGKNSAELVLLERGNHTLSFYLREPDASIDRFEIVQAFESCGELVQQAEHGEMHGPMQVWKDDDGHSRRTVVSGTGEELSKPREDSRVDYCFTVTEEGWYKIRANVKASDMSSNSMFWKINNQPENGWVWHMEVSDEYSRQSVSAGGDPSGQNTAKAIYLEKGNHTLSFYLREPDTIIDWFRIFPTAGGGDGGGGSDVDLNEFGVRTVDYDNVGVDPANYPNTVRVTGRSEADIERAIREAKPYTRIILPAGTYHVGTIDIRRDNVILSGESGNHCGETVIRFGSNDTGIEVGKGGYLSSSVNLKADARRNSTQIRVNGADQFNRGDYILIRQNDISELFRADLSRNPHEDWVRNNAMQYSRVVERSGDTLTLEGGLNLDYKTSRNARVAKVNNMINGVGIENLTLERTVNDSARYESANIYFKYAANSWVKGVHSKNSMRAHITFNRSYKSEVHGSYIEASFNNNGGYGYGVRLEGGTTNVLVENNIAKLLRHSYIAQIGANGNVFGYNYSTDPFMVGHGEIPTDLSVHGGFGHSNLFEGNQAQNAKLDNYHGSSSMNLFFRNRLEQDVDRYTYSSELEPKGVSTPHIWVHENQYYNAFLANEVGFPGANSKTKTTGFDSGRPRANFTVCKYLNTDDNERGCGRTRDTTIHHGTYDHLNQQAAWDASISQRQFPTSAYLSSKPAFMGNSAWPAFGPDTLSLSEGQKQIPAKARYLRGDFCDANG